MTLVGDLDMRGIRGDFVREVPEGANERLAAAIPELRILWNAGIKKFQLCHREDGWKEAFYGTEGVGVLEGWALIPPDYDSCDIERIIAECRVRQAQAKEDMAKYGPDHLAKVAEEMAKSIMAKKRAKDDTYLDEMYGWVDDGRGGMYNLFTSYSKPYGMGAKQKAKRDRQILALRSPSA